MDISDQIKFAYKAGVAYAHIMNVIIRMENIQESLEILMRENNLEMFDEFQKSLVRLKATADCLDYF